MKIRVLNALWEVLSFMCILTVGRVYIFRQEPTVDILIESALGGVIFTLLFRQYIKFLKSRQSTNKI